MEQGLQLNVYEKLVPELSSSERRRRPCILEENYPAFPSYAKLVHTVLCCRSSKSLIFARHAHISICNNGLEGYCSLGNHLVPMFVDCGSVLDAQQAFNRLYERNEHAWTSLISGYIQSGHIDFALDLYCQMQEHGVFPSPYTFMALLKACATTRKAYLGQEIYTEIVLKGFEEALSIGTALVTFYAKCCLLVEAHEVFCKLPKRDVASWTSLIFGYAENGQGEEALQVFQQMKQEGESPTAHTYVCVLKACSSLNAVNSCQEIHEEIRQNGFQSDLFVGSALVDFYAKCGFLEEAREAFDKLKARDVVVWTALIAGSAEHGHGQDALDFFDEMQEEGILPTGVTFTCVLKSCGSIGAIERGRELHRQIQQIGLQEDPSVANSVISMYSKCASLAEAQHVFDNLSNRDVVSWNVLITGYGEHGPWQQAVECFDKMLEMGYQPDAVTFSGILKACSSLGALEKGQEIHKQIMGSEFEMDLSISNTLVGMYANCGLFTEAQSVFEKVPCKSIMSWNALIAGYAAHGLNEEVLDCYHRMQHESLIPDNITVSCVLRGCSNVGALDVGMEVHTEITRRGDFISDPLVCKSLITMYATCGSLLEAEEEFQKLQTPDVTAWSLMIKCLGMHHKGNLSVQYFEDMLKHSVNPDAITFTSLLTACCHASLVLEGKKYFKMMKEVFHITPTVEHYNSMVNLMSRTGHLYEAEYFLEMLGCTSEEAWASILSACKTHGEVALGLRCFEQLVQINAEDSAWYVLMADLYASTGKKSDASRIEELRKFTGAKKMAAVASIEIDKKVHEFVVGDEPSEEVQAMLDDLSSSVKKKGHLPHIDLVQRPYSDGEKEEALCEHAEKMAIAFGLLNTPQGTTLRVSKNLRMCFDCHNTSKIISKVEKREIILRDSRCVHHFKDNKCSCGDIF